MNKPIEDKENFMGIVCEAYEELEKKLSPELFKLHEKFADALEGQLVKEIDFYFVEGFKLGLLIGIECMEED